MDGEFEERKRRLIRKYHQEHPLEDIDDAMWMQIVEAAKFNRRRLGWP